MFQNFNQIFQTARPEHAKRHQIARHGVEIVNDMLTCRVWIQSHTPQPQQHPDELLHIAQGFAQALAKQLDAEFSVMREGEHDFALRFTPPAPETFGEFHPAPAFTGKPTQSDVDALAIHAERNWRRLVGGLSGFNDAQEATAHAKRYGMEDTADAIETAIMQATVKQYRDALIDVADDVMDDDPLSEVLDRIDTIPAAVIRSAISSTLNTFGAIEYL